jgi:hypothetical protein
MHILQIRKQNLNYLSPFLFLKGQMDNVKRDVAITTTMAPRRTSSL